MDSFLTTVNQVLGTPQMLWSEHSQGSLRSLSPVAHNAFGDSKMNVNIHEISAEVHTTVRGQFSKQCPLRTLEVEQTPSLPTVSHDILSGF